MSEDNKNNQEQNNAENRTDASAPEAQAPPEAQVPFPYPYYGMPYAMPQGQPTATGQMQYPQYPMFIPVPMFMPPYGMPQGLNQGSADGQLNSYERQAGMQIVYQDNQEQQDSAQGMPGTYPYYPMMPMMPPYGYGAPPFQAQQQGTNKYDADVQVLYQAEEDSPETKDIKPITDEAELESQKKEKESGGIIGTLMDLFDEDENEEMTATAGSDYDEYSDEELAELFDEPFERRSFGQQLRDLFPHKTDSTGEKLRKSAFITSIMAILISAPILLNSFFLAPMKERNALKSVNEQIIVSSREMPLADIAEQYPGVRFPEGFNTKYASVYASNQDTAGWINIKSLDISYPIMQVKDNQYPEEPDGNKYYLTHAFDKTTNKHGTPFFDKNTRLQPGAMSKNLVVYGHNNPYIDLVFHNLVKYEDIKQWQAQPVIELDTIYGTYLWKIYGVFYSMGKAQKNYPYVFPYHWTEMSGEANFLNYIAEVDRRRLYDTGVDIKADDTLLTLSTCAYNFTDSRFVVVARMVRKGEDPNPDISKVVLRTDPQYPAFYYDKKRKQNIYSLIPDWYYSADM